MVDMHVNTHRAVEEGEKIFDGCWLIDVTILDMKDDITYVVLATGCGTPEKFWFHWIKLESIAANVSNTRYNSRP